MVQEAAEIRQKQSLESFFQDYDEKFRVGLEQAPKFLFRKIIDSSRTGVMGAAEVYDDFLPLLTLTKARKAEGLEMLLRDRTDDTLLDELWCLGFSGSMGGFAILAVDNHRSENPREIRRMEHWNQGDWQVIDGLDRSQMEEVFEAQLALAQVTSKLSQEATQNNPGFSAQKWNLLWD